MTKKVGIAVFVETPGVTPVRTELAVEIGQDLAAEFYKKSLKAIKSVLEFFERHTVYWAVAEKEERKNPIWSGFATIHQGEGGLGEKLKSVYDTLHKKHEHVIFLSGDTPQITVYHIIQAQLKLEHADFILAPAQNGGFSLFAGKAEVADVFLTASYDKGNAFRDLHKRLKALGSVALMEEIFDVDEKTDLLNLREVFSKHDDWTDEQLELAKWIDRNIL